MIRRCIRWAGAVLTMVPLLAIAPAAQAVEAGFYVGGLFGLSESAVKIDGFDAIAQGIYSDAEFIVTQTSSTIDTKDSAFGFFGGFRFSRHWAVEGGYMDVGKTTYHEQSSGNYDFEEPGSEPFSYAQTLTVRSRGLMVAGLGILPLSYRSELFARAGLIYMDNKLGGEIDDLRTGQNFSLGEQRESNSTWLAGVGYSFTFADIYAVRIEYQRVFDAGDDLWGKADIDLAMIGLAVTF